MSLDPSENTAIDSLRNELSRKIDSQTSQLTFTRRMVLAVLVMSVALVAFTFFNTVIELKKAPQTVIRQDRSSAPRDRNEHLFLAFIGILVAVFGILMLSMHGF